MGVDIIKLRDNIKRDVKGLWESIKDLRQLTPNNLEPFFMNLKPRPASLMVKFILFLGLFILLGYFITFLYNPRVLILGYPERIHTPAMAFKMALVAYITAISIPITMGYTLYLFDVRLVGVKIEESEAMSIIAYSTSFALMSGIFGIFLETWILHLMLIAYSIYMLYTAFRVKFGFETCMRCFILLFLVGCIMGIIMFKLTFSILDILFRFLF